VLKRRNPHSFSASASFGAVAGASVEPGPGSDRPPLHHEDPQPVSVRVRPTVSSSIRRFMVILLLGHESIHNSSSISCSPWWLRSKPMSDRLAFTVRKRYQADSAHRGGGRRQPKVSPSDGTRFRAHALIGIFDRCVLAPWFRYGTGGDFRTLEKCDPRRLQNGSVFKAPHAPQVLEQSEPVRAASPSL
jgi:hypothetical protein